MKTVPPKLRTGPPGVPRRMARRTSERASAEHAGGALVRYTWKCGHYRTATLTEPARGGGRRVVSERTAARLANWWSKEYGGVSCGPCPTCAGTSKQGST